MGVPMPFIVSALQVLAVMLISLIAGTVFGIWRGYNPAGYSASTFIEMHQGAVRGLNVLLPLMGLATLLITGATVSGGVTVRVVVAVVGPTSLVAVRV